MDPVRCPRCGTTLPSKAQYCSQCGTALSQGVVRIPIGKKQRFEVFKRDGFTCSYCGALAPQVGGTATLHVDHILPVAEGGTNDLWNLVTACDDCNRGKGADLLDDETYLEIERTKQDELERLREQMEVWKEYGARFQELRDVVSAAEQAKRPADDAALGYGIIPDDEHPLRRYEQKVERADRIAPGEAEEAQRATQALLKKLPPEIRFDARLAIYRQSHARIEGYRQTVQDRITDSSYEDLEALARLSLAEIDVLLGSLERSISDLDEERERHGERDRRRAEIKHAWETSYRGANRFDRPGRTGRSTGLDASQPKRGWFSRRRTLA